MSKQPFYIVHDDPKRPRVTRELFEQARSIGSQAEHYYDSLTTPITNDVFHARVDTLLADHLYGENGASNVSRTAPVIPRLTSNDTSLEPEDQNAQLLGIISPWIDLCSPDPAIYDVSRQILKMEVDFASFCGISAIVLPTPGVPANSGNLQGTSLYAAAVREILETMPHLSVVISFQMMDAPQDVVEPDVSLNHLGRTEFVGSPMPLRGLSETPAGKAQQSSVPDDSRSLSESTRRRIRVHDFLGTWDVWNTIRSLCKYNQRLFVDLFIPRYLPPSSICFRWQSEPLRVLSLDGLTFFSNPAGYPVLTANHRALINLYMKSRAPPCLRLCDIGPLPARHAQSHAAEDENNPRPPTNDSSIFSGPTPSEAKANSSRRRATNATETKTSLAHLTYLRWFQAHQPERSIYETHSVDFQDYLQVPLQPLADNLESMTYEVFEQDPVKYQLYEAALEKALLDWRDERKPTSGSDGRVVVAVVGAGRGPLVSRALKASVTTGVPIDLWALEKNQNAFVILERQNQMMWDSKVHLVHSDMRYWSGPQAEAGNLQNGDKGTQSTAKHYPIDIMVSELLGSFGDNELSPECLDQVMHLLNPVSGISIPQSYTAFLTPIASPKLHSEISSWYVQDPHSFNTPSVVCLQKFDFLSTRAHTSVKGPDIMPSPANSTLSLQPAPSQEYAASKEDDEDGQFVTKPPSAIIQPAWTFNHQHSERFPDGHNNQHNNRNCRLSFDLRHRGVCHGLAGYFESVLYPGINLSINPLTKDEHSPDMISWFPIFFPLKTPLYVPDYSTLVVSMFRATDARKVWYDWCVEAWSNLPGTGGGTGYRLGCSEMMCSKEKAVLM